MQPLHIFYSGEGNSCASIRHLIKIAKGVELNIIEHFSGGVKYNIVMEGIVSYVIRTYWYILIRKCGALYPITYAARIAMTAPTSSSVDTIRNAAPRRRCAATVTPTIAVAITANMTSPTHHVSGFIP